MAYPPLVSYVDQNEYHVHFERVYCQGPIRCFDGIAVRFRKADFHHCFFESSRRNQIKDQFSPQRAERIDWIKAALEDSEAELYAGWDNKRKRHDHSRRVAVVVVNYVVVIRLTGAITARFVTAYVADSETTINKIKRGPRWRPSGV